MKRFPLFLVLVALLTALPPAASAQSAFFMDRRSNPGETPQEWREQGLELPPPPREEDLLVLSGRDLPAGYTYRIDTRSVSVGESDDVVRYTMVIESRDGTRHVVFEGMRCWPAASKLYAVGTSSGFRVQEGQPWQAIPREGPFAYRHYLREGIACDVGNLPYAAENIVERIRRPQVRSANQDRQPFFHDSLR